MAVLSEAFDTSKLFLHAVNVLLQTINEPPIDTEEDMVSIEEASIAASVIIETKRTVLTEGWNFNQDDGYTFPTDPDGYIPVPYNVLDISSSDGDVIMRDWRLYSRKNQSAIFDEAQKMDVVWDYEFNSLTHPLRQYVTIKAARVFQARQVMDTNVYSFTQNDEEQAYVIARRSEGRTKKYNMLTSAYGTDNRIRS